MLSNPQSRSRGPVCPAGDGHAGLMTPESHRLQAVAQHQYGAISRDQVRRLGGDDNWIRTQLAAQRWVRIHPGVYLSFTGEPSWSATAFAGLLYAGKGAALSHRSAGYSLGMINRAPRPIEVSVPHHRQPAPQPGMVIRRRRVMPMCFGRIPATNAADTLIDIAATSGDVDEVVRLAREALRHVHIAYVRKVLEERQRLRHRSLLTEILGAVEAGIESPLEYRYRRDVERRHRLPRSVLQVRQLLDGLWIRADSLYRGRGVRVELDGQVAHPGGRTDSDVWRDNAALVATSDLTLRYRWAHVAGNPCATARQVAQALQSRGWRGRPTPCGPRCAVGR